MEKIYLGIDNGATASIGVIGGPTPAAFHRPPIKKEPNYHKKASNISRIDFPAWLHYLQTIQALASLHGCPVFAVLEKPFTGMAHTAVLSGRVYEAEIIGLETRQIPYTTIPSSDWQGTAKIPGLLPTGTKGSAACKRASAAAGVRLFPHLEADIKRHGDADGLLIAEWARRKNL